MNKVGKPHMLFITGTDTGVGKTFVTSLLLLRLQALGVRACALKPVSCGDRTDAMALQRLQPNLDLAAINWLHFDQPLSPWSASRVAGVRVSVGSLAKRIQQISNSYELTLVEGVGGILTPFNRIHTNLSLLQTLGCPSLLVCPNRLGVLNQACLGTQVLQIGGGRDFCIVLKDISERGDHSCERNLKELRMLLPDRGIFRVPFVATMCLNHWESNKCEYSRNKLEKSLEAALNFDTFSPLFKTFKARVERRQKNNSITAVDKSAKKNRFDAVN